MGKISSIFVLLLMFNIVGYILMGAMIAEGMATGNAYAGPNSLLESFYTPLNQSGNAIYVLSNESALFENVPQQTPSSFIQQGISFVDRIFILFGFVQTILGVILFPIALLSFMGLPWEMTMLIFGPLMGLYILGIIDLLSGGDS